MSTQNKLITLPKKTLKSLGVLAALKETNPKNYIEDKLIELVQNEREKGTIK